MINRLLDPSKNRGFFLFGARGTGKTTFLRERFFKDQAPVLSINLLQPSEFDVFLRDPSELSARIDALPKSIKKSWIAIDEIQKIPALLDLIHHHIEEKKIRFALTGSSARKLKRGGANLLAGRASVYHLFPFSSQELGSRFRLQDALEWGTLPGLQGLTLGDRKEFLSAYTQTYLREEILEEQLVRKVAPFRRFLDIAAQCSGQIVNYSNIARDCGSDPVSIQSYFEILEDTLLGFRLPPFHESIRKRQRQSPKFYLFDLGIKRAFDGTLGTPLLQSTSAYGLHFEHFVIQEIQRLASYHRMQWRYSYLRTKDDVEIDLIIEQAGAPPLLIEIKSSDRIREFDLSSFSRITADFKRGKAFCFSNDPHPKKIGAISVLPWRKGLVEIGLV